MKEIFEDLARSIEAGDENKGVEEAVHLAEDGIAPLSIYTDCIQPCLNQLGDRFSRLEIFLPELMTSANVVRAIQDALLPFLKQGQAPESKGRVVIGTAYGDIHEIGKDIVKIMLEVNGFQVQDLGPDVSPDQFINTAIQFDADLIAISALMSPSIPYVRDTIDRVKDNEEISSRFKIMVGGGPVSQEWADQVRADGYADDAAGAVEMALSLVVPK
jgi:methanogenic corrinoid protein MtbC1